MDKIEKKEFMNNILKICLEDLNYFNPEELNNDFMIDLFKNNKNTQILEFAYSKQSKQYTKPYFLLIKEYIIKFKVNEDFLIKMIQDYTKINTNMIQILTNTKLLDSKFEKTKEFVLNVFFNSSNSHLLTFEQIKKIYSKIEINPEKLIFLISRCTNKLGYSKCDKTFVERSNIILIKNIIRETENKYKCKLNIDLYK